MAAALLVSGCGSNHPGSASAPASQNVASSGGSGQAAGVAALAAVTPKTLCVPEGKGKPKKQCVAGLARLGKGKAKNPRAACKSLSKKKTKGVRGKSPYAVCVTAAAALMASKHATAGNGSASGQDATDTSGTDTSGADNSADSTDTSGLVCTDSNGNTVPIDSPDVEECDDVSASDSSNGSGTDTSGDFTSAGDTSTDGG